ncbi:AAHS family benzoate transporter-like MFS transporter [Kineococcus xinjiangensis]|uniref:AAHS family benzoate transporter-like MFS transporter n=1 Tax=Kineococcus xinjiangensis TaxID=512762 RepID=A0A2S6IHV8_9ACTN|nr:MFS transporter [Kineococcus xinjiangensis]PPK93797.1 AAHS family benzoate transporter-like MFS transporter [Kineococcus xinjiangensis]
MTTPTSPQWPVPQRTTNKVLLACWLAILAEGYDVGVLGAVLPALAEHREWSLTPLQLGGLGAYALVGMLIGAMTIGTLSDRLGRKKMLLASMFLFTTTQLGAALAPTPEVFGLFRLLGGLGMGGIIPVAAALTIEYSAPRRRSFNYGLMFSAYSLGILVAAVVAIALLPTLGWRWVVGVGCLPVVLIPLLAVMVPESLEFLMGKGRREEAARLAAKLRIAPFVEGDWTPAPAAGTDRAVGWKDALAVMFTRGFLRPTVFFWVSLFCGMVLVYGLNTWLPSIMKKAGYDLGSSLTFLVVFSLASAIGGILLGRAADARGRKPVLVLFYLLGGVGILLLMFPNHLVVNYVFVALAGIGSISTSLVLTAWVADYYPSYARGTATGWALSFARIGAISGPLIGGWIGSMQLPFQWNFIVFAAVAVAAATAVALIPRVPPSQRAATAGHDEHAVSAAGAR